MTAATANLINALTLIVCSAWAFAAIAGGSFTALIPGAFGFALLACHGGLRNENKTIAHIAAVLTLVVLIALLMPLSSALGSGETMRMLRSLAMMATTVLAMVFFIKSFRDARKARQEAEG